MLSVNKYGITGKSSTHSDATGIMLWQAGGQRGSCVNLNTAVLPYNNGHGM
jgi:hypothetical protein